MLRRASYQLDKKWTSNAMTGFADFVKRNIPDPRRDPMQQRPVGYEDLGSTAYTGFDGQEKLGETLEEYMKKRNERWSEMNADLVKGIDATRRPDGTPFSTRGTRGREGYMSVSAQNQDKIEKVKTSMSEVDEEKLKLRRQLQVENEAEYRKFVAETKRAELTDQSQSPRRLPHPADPNYDPFKNTPSYRPQDSTKLAQWLKRQRESGRAVNGMPLTTKEGQERFYNEEKMATQYHANPFATRMVLPKGYNKMEVNALSPDSFFIQDKEIIGSVICTPSRYYHWNASTFEDINKRTMSLLLHMYPVPDMLFLGTGRNQYFIDEELRIEFAKRGTVVHCLTSRDAAAYYGIQLSGKRRAVAALLACVPTNPYGVECFGDFIENDIYIMSDTAVGVKSNRQFNPYLYRTNNAAEKYRDVQGTGYGPKYMMDRDGRLLRPGTSGTKLRPLLEPGEDVEWDKLPSYFHWYPKERMEDYIENTTWREVASTNKHPEERIDLRMKHLHKPDQPEKVNDVQPAPDIMPWDSASIPLPKWEWEKNPDGEITVHDPNTGRMVGMKRPAFDKWRRMMKMRAKGIKPDVEVEFDQEQFVTDRNGRITDMGNTKYTPVNEGRYIPHRKSKTGRGNMQVPHQ